MDRAAACQPSCSGRGVVPANWQLAARGARRREHPGAVRPRCSNSKQVNVAALQHSSCSKLLRDYSSSLGSSLSSLEGGRLRVAVDVDEVLGRFVHSLNKFLEEAYGLQHEVGDYWVYEFARIWGCSADESNHRVHAFFQSHHFAGGIEPIPGAYDSLSRLRDACELVVVTSRQHVIQAPTLEWLQSHFPGVFSEVHFGNHFAMSGASRKKSEICAAIGADVLIDDNPSYALECAQAGIRVLLYDWQHSYPWAKTRDGPRHDLITRVRDWEEVEQVLGVLAAALGSQRSS